MHPAHCSAVCKDRSAKFCSVPSYTASGPLRAIYTLRNCLLFRKFRPSAWARAMTILRKRRFCFCDPGESRTNLPAQVDAVRTRVIEQPLFAKRGAISAQDSAMLEKSVAPPQLVYPVFGRRDGARKSRTHRARRSSDEAGWRTRRGHRLQRRLAGEAALMIFYYSRRSARSDSSGDRWSTHART